MLGRVEEALSPARRRFRNLAWSVLVFNVLVVLGGAIVRATGSGDGCGASWPRCTDRLFPANPGIETVIEFGHRITSALAIFGVVALFLLGRRLYEAGHRVRRSATASLVLLVFEALLGAALVLFGWVDQDASVGRMVIVPLHLVNTYMLVAALTLTAWWASGMPPIGRPVDAKVRRRLALGAAALLTIGAVGALNALSDSLYPVESFLEGVRAETSADAAWLLRVRLVHPIIAIAFGLWVASTTTRLAVPATEGTKRYATILRWLIVVQLLVGASNVLLAVPLELQVVHLAIADAIWIAYLVFGAALLGETRTADLPVETAA